MSNVLNIGKIKKIFVCVCSLFVLFLNTSRAANPKPDPADLLLPMPKGEEMAFRPVFIGEGAEPYALKEFKMGDLDGGYKETPTHASVGGSFKRQNSNGSMDWCYYIGKYEISEKQYYAIMDSAGKTGGNKPMTGISWFDATAFAQKYSLWLFENAEATLPHNGEMPGFLRLPTEEEWEFAARGGTAVDKATFQSKTPYTKRLSKYEWFAGPKSSHGKIKNIGILEPNPLKLYDLLGNVSEMTYSRYMIEYSQGRSGGFVAKGGNVFTPETSLRSSMRNEIPFYKKIKGKMMSSAQPMLGFRLVISAPIFSSRAAAQDLESAWDEYAASRHSPGSDKETIKNLTTQINELTQQTKILETELAKKRNSTQVGLTSAITGAIKQIKATTSSAKSRKNYDEKDAAFAWIKVATDSAMMVRIRDFYELPKKKGGLGTAKKLLEMAEKSGDSKKILKFSQIIKKISSQIEEMEMNINDLADTIDMAFGQLDKLSEPGVARGGEKYITFLKTNNIGRFNPDSQIKMTSLLTKHYKMYRSKHKLDPEKLKQDIKNISLQ